MEKRYGVKIPKLINLEDAQIAVQLLSAGLGIELVEKGKMLVAGNFSIRKSDISEEWLEEIKDKPMSAEEAEPDIRYWAEEKTEPY